MSEKHLALNEQQFNVLRFGGHVEFKHLLLAFLDDFVNVSSLVVTDDFPIFSDLTPAKIPSRL